MLMNPQETEFLEGHSGSFQVTRACIVGLSLGMFPDPSCPLTHPSGAWFVWGGSVAMFSMHARCSIVGSAA